MEITTSTVSKRMVTGMFNDKQSAENAYHALQSRGYSNDEINMVMTEETKTKYFSNGNPETDLGHKALENSNTGLGVGGTITAVVGAIAVITTSIIIPGLGLIVAGPIAAGLASAGGLTSGVKGALMSTGIPAERAKEYEAGVKNGGIVMGVNARNDEDAAFFEKQWQENNGENINR